MPLLNTFKNVLNRVRGVSTLKPSVKSEVESGISILTAVETLINNLIIRFSSNNLLVDNLTHAKELLQDIKGIVKAALHEIPNEDSDKE